MYQVLYRKYRPKVFADVYGQEHITSTLINEIKEGVFPTLIFLRAQEERAKPHALKF